ncbi:hypothetical protein RF11_15142 [Thelohanellus kitauei]|uniref:Uncharacterized protein n=1 Tax=Thelohanellus kitauei TaxID=669202 RepID=A0A0C2MG35_THEKT|nr:hypothetical protein RF11_15142 [Thelohanellus kitauei]
MSNFTPPPLVQNNLGLRYGLHGMSMVVNMASSAHLYTSSPYFPLSQNDVKRMEMEFAGKVQVDGWRSLCEGVDITSSDPLVQLLVTSELTDYKWMVTMKNVLWHYPPRVKIYSYSQDNGRDL